MAMYQIELPVVFGALSDPTRFSVVERLARGPATVSELAAPYGLAGPSFLKHLKVLEHAGLVTSRKVGRVRTVELAPETIDHVERWIRAHRNTWKQRLDALGNFLEKDLQ